MMWQHCLHQYQWTQFLTSYILLEQDTLLHDRTVLSVQNIIQLLGFYLHNTYFSFQGQFYEEVEGAAMGSLVSPIVVKLYMEHFERKALSTATTPQAVYEIRG